MFYRVFQHMRKISFVLVRRMANRAGIRAVIAVFLLAMPVLATAQHKTSPRHPANENPPAATPVILDTMTTELNRAFTSLGKQGDAKQLPPYFLSYSVSDATMAMIQAQYGALVNSASNHVRVADVIVRLGEHKLDNTHGTHRSSALLIDDLTIRRANRKNDKLPFYPPPE
jgi:hypothetical protein